MFSIAAINDTDSRHQWEPLAPTKEAQEFHLTQTYHEGLLKLQAKDYAKARELLETVLKDPLLMNFQAANAGDGHLLQLRFLALKNLATVFLQQGSEHYENALHCYLQAVEIDTNDSVVWNQLGTLSCTMGILGTSRWAFEQGLLCSPNNWNCMEKLLEVLIAIGDEVACLSLADLILRRWPSHSRALHVKKTIEDPEPIPFAPRGIDKLQPEHVRLKFPNKRKGMEYEADKDALAKRREWCIEVHLAQATWATLADAILGIILRTSGKVSEPKIVQSNGEIMNEKAVSGQTKVVCNAAITDEGTLEFQTHEKIECSTSIRIAMRLSTSSEITVDSSEGKGQGFCAVSTGTSHISYDFEKTKMVKEKEIYADKEHPHERRSSRLERLRSRKLGKEDLELTNGKDLAKAVYQFLEPFILGRTETKSLDCSRSPCGPSHDTPPYSSIHEYNDVMHFISEASKTYGAYHMGHMFLEEVAQKDIPFQDCFVKFLELERLTRHWGQDRTPLCSLFLAELYYDQGLSSDDDSRQVELFSEASYHLCKVIESVVLDFPDDLVCIQSNDSWIANHMINPNTTAMQLDCAADNKSSVNSSQDLGVAVVEDSLSQEPIEQKLTLTKTNAFWVRFFWLSGHLSLSSKCKEKAFNEFCICLSLLRCNTKSKDSPEHVFLPHCKHVERLTVYRVLHKINLLKRDSLLEKTTEMIGEGLYRECIDLLAPLLLSTKDLYPDIVSGASRESERLASVELSALNSLMSACEKAEPMNIEVYMNCHFRKLQVLTSAAGMLGPPMPQKDRILLSEKTCADPEHMEATRKNWMSMVAMEIKDISRGVSQVKHIIDQNETYDDFSTLVCIIRDIQYLILTVMSCTVRTILNQKLSGSGTSNQMDQWESWCLVDAAIAFCKLQHLDPSVPIKNQVDLIVAVHDLLAEYGLCCSGGDSEGDKGTFLKFAIKHLLALDAKLKSLNGRLELDTKQQEGLVLYPGLERTGLDESKMSPAMNLGTNGKEESSGRQKDASEDQTYGYCLAHEGLDKDDERVSNGKCAQDVKLDSCRERSETDFVAAVDNPSMEIEIEKVVLGIENALDQTFFCLYGLNINPDPSTEDDLAIHKNTSRGDYQTKEQCADVFQYILPYANALSRTGLVKLRRVLRAIHKHFPQPPDEILAGNAIDRFLDSPEVCEDKLSEFSGAEESQDSIISILFNNGRSLEALQSMSVVRSEPYFEVYSNLYYLISQAEEISALDKYAGFVLKKEGEEFVEQNANLFKYDLLYNPLRFESWQKLANIYDEEVDLLMNDGSKHINVMDWRKNTTLPQRVEIGRRRSRRCLFVSLALAKTPVQQSQIHELLALVYYDNIQNVVPYYDQRCTIPTKNASWMAFCQNSMKHFEKAFALKPEWLHAFYLGKLCEKLGYSSDKAFAYYSKAASLNPSAVDPVHRMHASRLKLLYTRGRQNVDILKTVAVYAFSQSTREAIMDMFNWTSQDLLHPTSGFKGTLVQDDINEENSIETSLLDKAWNLLYNDCLSALEICVEGDLKHFHKARYMLAQGLYKRRGHGDLERAKDELSFCFKSSRSSFTVNMWEIDGTAKKGRRKYPGLSGNKRSLEVGLSESSRKFITCIRKYILFYLNLLDEAGDLWTLEKAYSYLRTDKRFALCLGDIVPISLGKFVLVLTQSIRNAESHGSCESSTSLEQLLEKMFNIFIDHASLWADISCLPEVNHPSLSESNLCGYIHQYIDILESDLRLDVLEGVNEKIRKRFKNPKLSNSNFARICKHASLAWCRSIIIKLAMITPLPDGEHTDDQSVGLESSLLLFLDLEPDELLSSSLEGHSHSKGIDMNWYETLSKIKNIHIRQAAEDNIESAISLMRSAYSFYKESSCGLLPSGINLYTAPSLKMAAGGLESDKGGSDILDLSIPRKLLLWAYTLVHGHYLNISTVVKYCEDHVKSRMRRALAGSIHVQASMHTSITHAGGGEVEDNLPISIIPSSHQAGTASSSNAPLISNEPQKIVDPTQQLQRCNTSTEIDKKQECIEQNSKE